MIRRIRAVKWPFRLLIVFCVFALVFAVLFLWLWRYRNDEFLARYIMRTTNPRLRGRIELRRVHWGTRALVDLALGTPTPVSIDHFAVYDPHGTLVIFAPRATGKMELLPLVTGGHMVVRKLQVTRGQCLVAETRGPGGAKEIGLVAAFAPARPKTSGKRGPRIEFLRFDVRDVEVSLRFPDWSLQLQRVASEGSFIYPGGVPSVEGILYDLQPRAPEGKLVIRGLETPLRNFSASRFQVASNRPMDLRTVLSVEAGGARVRVRGALLRIYRKDPGVEVNVTSPDIQRFLTRLLGTAGAGPGRVVATISGPLGRPTIDARLFDVGLGTGTLRASGVGAHVVLDLGEGRLDASEVTGRMLRGAFAGGATMSLTNGEWNGRATVRDVDPGQLVPQLGGQLDGKLELSGALSPVLRANVGMNLALRRRVQRDTDLLPPRIDVTGTLHAGPTILDLADVALKGEGSTLRARGSVNLESKGVNLKLALEAPRLGAWLARRRLPQVAESGRAELHARGRYPDLRATGNAVLRGVGHRGVRLAQVATSLELAGGELRLDRVRSDGYGGKLSGEARLSLFEGNVTRLARAPSLRARARGDGIDVGALGLAPHATGRANLQVEVTGPLQRLEGTAAVRFPSLRLFGDRYDGARARLGLLGDRLSVYEGHLPRSSGGRVDVRGDLYFDERIDAQLSASAVPLAKLPGLASGPVPVSGRVGGKLDISGTLAAPRLSGLVQLAATKVRGMSFGSGEVRLTPGADGIRIDGKLGQHVRAVGLADVRQLPRVHLTVDVTRLPLEKLFHELRKLGDVQGLASGRISLDADRKAGLSKAEMRFSSAELSLRTRPPGERSVRVLRLRNQGDLVARYNGQRLQTEAARLVTSVEGERGQRAEFTVGGWISSERVEARLWGKVPVELAGFFFPKHVKKLSGDAEANVRLVGPLADPSLDGRLSLNYISVLPVRFDRPIEIAQGQIRLVPGKLRVDGLKIQMDRSRMTAAGELRLERLRPTTAELALSGDLNVKLLQLFFPEQLSNASGATSVDLKLSGPIRDPQLSGRLTVKRVDLSPRGWGRSITLNRGEVAFSNYLVKTVTPLTGTYDEGLIRLSGEVRLDQWELVDVYVNITGTGIPHREPKVYTAEVNLSLLLLGDSKQLALQGDVELVDARYIRTFDVIRQAFIKPRAFEEETPFWKGSPLLENLQLKLQVQSTGQLSVKNNYADLSLSGALAVSGTIGAPRLDGQVRVEGGTFRIPFLRGDYTISRGDITLDRKQPVDEAEINITGETSFLDRSGVDYQIKLALLGPLNKIGIQLSSNPALDQGQIVALLAFGRTTDQLRTQLRGAAEGASAGTQAAGAADAQVKQLTGEILSQIIEEPLKKVTRLDLIRFEVGTESAQLKACKKLAGYVNLCGNYEQGLLGDTRAEGWAEVKLSDLFSLVGKVEHLSTRLEAETLPPTRGRGELKIRLPLR